MVIQNITYWQVEVVTTQSVFCVEGDGLWETGELITVEFTLISTKYLHIVMRYLTPRAVESIFMIYVIVHSQDC